MQIISISDYASKYNCKQLGHNIVVIEKEYQIKNFGWVAYVHYYLTKNIRDVVIPGPIFLPDKCGYKHLILKIPKSNLKLHVDYYRQYSIRGDFHIIDINDLIKRIITHTENIDNNIIYLHNLFSIQMNQLVKAINDIKSKYNNIRIFIQQHSQAPYLYYNIYGKKSYFLFALYNEKLFRKISKYIDGFIVINRLTSNYLKELGLGSRILYQPVGVDFDSIRPTGSKNIHNIIKEFLQSKKYNQIQYQLFVNNLKKLEECKINILTYAIVTKLYGGRSKGIEFIPYVAKQLYSNQDFGKACIIIAGNILDLELARSLLKYDNVLLMGHLDREDFIRLLSSVDLYMLLAKPELYFGGIGVSVIEALASDIPVVSPTLIHYPNPKYVKYLGKVAPWVKGDNIDKFVNKIIEAIIELNNFRPRYYAKKYFDIRVMSTRIFNFMMNVIM